MARIGKRPNLKLIELRVNAGLSRRELAHLTGISCPTIGLAESGHVPSPRVQFELADHFELRPLDIWPIRIQKEVAHAGRR